MVGFELKIWNPRGPLARDKLREAEFHLENLQRVGDRQPDFRYLFSATISAARSVTWTLQSDLRGRFGSSFDQWWQEARTQLPVGTWTFEALAEARNLSQKQGNVYPAPIYVLEFDRGPLERAEYAWVAPGADVAASPAAIDVINNEMKTSGLVMSHLVFRIDDPLVAELLHEDNLVDGKPTSEVAQRLIAVARSFLRARNRKPNLDGYAVGGDRWIRSAQEIVDDFRTYLAALKHLLDDADRLFPYRPDERVRLTRPCS